MGVMGQSFFKLLFQGGAEGFGGMEDQVAAKGKKVAYEPVVHRQTGAHVKIAPGQRGDLGTGELVVNPVGPVFKDGEVERGHDGFSCFGKGDGGIGLKGVPQNLQILDAEQLEHAVVLSRMAVGLKIPVVAFEQQLDGISGALAFLPVGAPVGKVDGAPVENGVFELL